MQDMSGMVHPNPLSMGIPTKIKRVSLVTGHQIIPIFKKLKIDKMESFVGNINHSVHIIPP